MKIADIPFQGPEADAYRQLASLVDHKTPVHNAQERSGVVSLFDKWIMDVLPRSSEGSFPTHRIHLTRTLEKDDKRPKTAGLIATVQLVRNAAQLSNGNLMASEVAYNWVTEGKKLIVGRTVYASEYRRGKTGTMKRTLKTLIDQAADRHQRPTRVNPAELRRLGRLLAGRDVKIEWLDKA